MFLGPSGRAHGPQNHLPLISGPPEYSKSLKKITNLFLQNVVFGNLKILDIESLEMLEKTRAGNP